MLEVQDGIQDTDAFGGKEGEGKKVKTDQKHLDLFKREVLKWLDVFKISGWEYYFEFDEKDRESIAGSRWNLDGRVMTFELSRHQQEENLTSEAIRSSALHEVLHVILARLMTLATRRYIGSKDEITEAVEEAVNTLMNYILKEKEK